MTEKENACLLLVDPLAFRRAALAGLLETWGGRHNLSVVAASPAELPDGFDLPACQIVFVKVDGAPTGEIRPDPSFFGHLPKAPVVIISDGAEYDQVLAACQKGAAGYVPFTTEPGLAFEAFTFILKGGTYYPPSVLLSDRVGFEPDQCVHRSEGGLATNDTPDVCLTQRQTEVAQLLRQGLSNKLIARQLSTTESTVKIHVRQIMRKLGCDNRTQAALLAERFSKESDGGELQATVSPTENGSRHLD